MQCSSVQGIDNGVPVRAAVITFAMESDDIGRYSAIWVDESMPYLGPLAAVSDPQAV
jgi:hypothetical protein